MNHYTTLAQLREKKACRDRYEHLVAALGPDWGDDAPILLSRILEINGIQDAVWALRADLHPDAEKTARLFSCDLVEQIALTVWEKIYPDDPRPRVAVETSRRYAAGAATALELAAAGAAARAAARAAAWDAARAAAWAAAWTAARAAAWKKAAVIYRKYYSNEE